jgi:hypothetical protein
MKIVAALLFSAVSGFAQDSLLQQGLALARADRLSDAGQLFRRAATQYPDDKRFLIELAGVLYREHRNGTAEHFLHRALALDPSDPYGIEFLGTLYLLDGNTEAALKYWNRIGKPLIQDVHLPARPELVDISGGQIFTLQRLWQTEANLDRLDIYSGYHFDLASRGLTPSEDQRYDLTVRLDTVSQPFGGWLGTVLPYLRALPYQTIDIDRYDIAHRAINFTSLWRWDPNKRHIETALSGTLHSDPRYRYRFLLDARDERWDLIGTYLRLRKLEAGGDLIAGLSARLQWTGGIRVAGRWIAHADNNPVFDSGWSLEARNRLDYRLLSWPDHRFHLNAAASIDAGHLSAAYTASTADLTASWFPQRTGVKWEITGRVRAGVTTGALPFDEYFQLGMERDNDLWFRGIVGTRDGQKGNAPLGTNYTLAQTDIQRTLFHAPFITINAGPFFDEGRISGPSPDFGSRGWLSATGIQTRIKTVDRLNVSLVYGRDLRSGQGVFYTSVTR